MRNVVYILFFYTWTFSADLMPSPALTDNALATVVNPAGLGSYRRPNFVLNTGFTSADRFTFTGSLGGLGLGLDGDSVTTRYLLSNGFRIRNNLYAGIRTAYSTIRNKGGTYQMDCGFLYRPLHLLSIGLVTENLFTGWSSTPLSISTSVGLQPLDFVFLHVNGSYRDGVLTDPRLGVEILLDGMALFGSANPQQGTYSAGISLSLAHVESGILYPLNKHGKGLVSLSMSQDRKAALFEPQKWPAVISIEGTIQDIEPDFSLLGDYSVIPLAQLLAQLRNAARDNDVSTVILKVGSISAGLGVVEELRNAILELRISGKRVICYLENAELLEYYLGSTSDQIVVAPLGEWAIAGIRSEVLFFKGAMEKLGIRAEFERVGKYKSAIEPYTQDSMSSAFRENETELLKSIYDQIVDGIATARDLEKDSVTAMIDRGTVRLGEAINQKLIDDIGYFSDLVAEYSPSGEEKYIDLSSRTYYKTGWGKRRKIALVHATGTIISGESFSDFFFGENFMGAETMADIFKEIRQNDEIKAVCIRINSPGGSGTASDIIWHEIEKLKEAGKAVVVSVADMAASGGYYMACNADTIVCNAGSIVGSIGVYSGKFVLKGLYDKIGLKKEIVKFGKNADAFSDYADFTDEQRLALQTSVHDFYDEFVSRVAQGRRMSKEKVDSLGRGRVFTGAQAKEYGLVDVIGGLSDAIDITKRMAGFSDEETPDFEVFPKRKGFFATISEDGTAKVKKNFLRAFSELSAGKYLAILPWKVRID
ncbi:MAG: signal peptide peptidase SppA [Candidatus Raymondbacteria bacterium RifOxyA12_full_50_37]|uniref:Signal peptide peptidase SppA n=1 Tax=Candidatus Raymondbacteria bacterium RIFOXYD12_FULL_49_13 TaxID=1817890 RepID=A0A1F7F4A5_UNCRA|nr:MAG: signal peptide peptidase SppA [Candidatus Raymondbacteria bacterium RifOxyA12_full_50_37]OGJ93853.1 MAG: signal peptide peptidase SppA [Candidatus Raymondbacteria bacterium RIFOXYA2_FULL_49_16]OGJ97313.1 MAG: signal peptide peptidase SppA [Candidatus Raymondbacteria bacterium RifOxyC12_full_50_8]OGJ98279.1 MAG: signal peptide peptidase SppA [Candidatus Raymondbacteria bacterium RIFOXYC2_FULL_50_21]OGJ98442.1 MAG: signal peptide peptidase SppA [Candidatus Raymondbacteria bacterium RifOxy